MTVEVFTNENNETVALDANGRWRTYNPQTEKFGGFAKAPLPAITRAPGLVEVQEQVIALTQERAALLADKKTAEGVLQTRDDQIKQLKADLQTEKNKPAPPAQTPPYVIAPADAKTISDLRADVARLEKELEDEQAKPKRLGIRESWKQHPINSGFTTALGVAMVVMLIWFGAAAFAPLPSQQVLQAQAELGVCNTKLTAADVAKSAAEAKATATESSLNAKLSEVTAELATKKGELEKAQAALMTKVVGTPKKAEPLDEPKPAAEKPKDEAKLAPAADVVSPKGDAAKQLAVTADPHDCKEFSNAYWSTRVGRCMPR